MTEHRLDLTAAEAEGWADGRVTRYSWLFTGGQTLINILSRMTSGELADFAGRHAPWQVGDLVKILAPLEMTGAHVPFGVRVRSVSLGRAADVTEEEALAEGMEHADILDMHVPPIAHFDANWSQRHPGHPFATSWAWGMGFEVVR